MKLSVGKDSDYVVSLSGTGADVFSGSPPQVCDRCKSQIANGQCLNIVGVRPETVLMCYGCIAFMLLNYDTLAARLDKLEKAVTLLSMQPVSRDKFPM